MKIVDWFKSLLKKTKSNHMLTEGNVAEDLHQEKKEVVPKIDVSKAEHKKSREDIIRSLRNDMIIEDFSEEFNNTKFSPESIRENYDVESLLSDEDMTALNCLFGAIKDGVWHSKTEIVNGELRRTGHKINDFLKKSPDNIVILINLMEKSAKDLYESLGDKKFASTTVQGLIPGSYSDISQLIEEYMKENEIEGR